MLNALKTNWKQSDLCNKKFEEINNRKNTFSVSVIV